MPTYEYQCLNGHKHERVRIPVEDETPRTCPECMKPAHRVMSIPQQAVVKGGTKTFHGR